MPATWLRNARTPSFKGEPLPGCREIGTTLTPRIVRHEYPGVDGGWVEHLNRGLTSYMLTWSIAGIDYMDRRDIMEAALDVPEPGLLVHPTRGEMFVSVETVDIAESAGVAVFTVTFVESGRPAVEPAGTPSTGSALLSSVATGLEAAGVAFEEAFGVDNLPAWAQTDTITAVTEQVQDIQAAVESAVGGTIQGFSDLVSDLDDLEEEIDTLIDTPDVLAGRFGGVLVQIGDLKVYRLLTGNAGIPDATAGLTAVDTIVAENATSTARMVMRMALSAWGQTVQSTTWASYDEVQAEAAVLSDRLSLEAGYASDDEYQALVDLRVAIAAYLSDQASRLPRLRTVRVSQPTSVLTLAWRHHADPTRCDEVQDRNGIIDGAWAVGNLRILGA